MVQRQSTQTSSASSKEKFDTLLLDAVPTAEAEEEAGVDASEPDLPPAEGESKKRVSLNQLYRYLIRLPTDCYSIAEDKGWVKYEKSELRGVLIKWAAGLPEAFLNEKRLGLTERLNQVTGKNLITVIVFNSDGKRESYPGLLIIREITEQLVQSAREKAFARRTTVIKEMLHELPKPETETQPPSALTPEMLIRNAAELNQKVRDKYNSDQLGFANYYLSEVPDLRFFRPVDYLFLLSEYLHGIPKEIVSILHAELVDYLQYLRQNNYVERLKLLAERIAEIRVAQPAPKAVEDRTIAGRTKSLLSRLEKPETIELAMPDALSESIAMMIDASVSNPAVADTLFFPDQLLGLQHSGLVPKNEASRLAELRKVYKHVAELNDPEGDYATAVKSTTELKKRICDLVNKHPSKKLTLPAPEAIWQSDKTAYYDAKKNLHAIMSMDDLSSEDLLEANSLLKLIDTLPKEEKKILRPYPKEAIPHQEAVELARKWLTDLEARTQQAVAEAKLPQVQADVWKDQKVMHDLIGRNLDLAEEQAVTSMHILEALEDLLKKYGQSAALPLI